MLGSESLDMIQTRSKEGRILSVAMLGWEES